MTKPNPTPLPAVRRWNDPPNQPDELDRPRPVFNPAPSTVGAVELDPYPERLDADQGVSQHTDGHQAQILKFTPADSEPRLVVDTDVVVIGQMTADEPPAGTPHTRHRQQPHSGLSVGRPLARWALALSIVASATVILAVSTANTPPMIALVAVTVVVVCCALLIVAEHLTMKARR